MLSDHLTRETRFQLRLTIEAELESNLSQPVDLILLNDAPPLLLSQVIRDGILLFERNRAERCLFEVKALNRYYDARPYLDYHNRQLTSRIVQEGLGHGYRGHHNALEAARRLRTHLASDAEYTD